MIVSRGTEAVPQLFVVLHGAKTAIPLARHAPEGSTMAFEGMATPLGIRPGLRQQGVPPLWRRWLLAVLCLTVAILVLVASLRWSGERVAPGAVAVIERASEVIVARPSEPLTNGTDKGRGDSQADKASKAQRTTLPGGGLVIKVPEAVGPPPEPIFDNRVGERTEQGILPVVSASGHKAYKLYSRPFPATDKPIIAIVMTGVGISPRGTEAAIRLLPSEVTLAFAPYGRDLEASVTSARGEGHEILLQVPLEPLDFPQSDPGPHTLRAGEGSGENVARLRWLMSRFPGYVGLTNFMGSRIMRDQAAFGALLEEVNRRGLLFLDDGTVNGSLTASLGKTMNLPAATADRVLETGGRKSLDQMLGEVEQLARARKRAVMTVPALPANIERIAAFAKEARERGLVLAPISAIMARNAP
jgi:polysaccharide deacetylase 2 family uncharacterized protein YibQ